MCVMRHGVFIHGRPCIVRSPRAHPRRSSAAEIRRWSDVPILRRFDKQGMARDGENRHGLSLLVGWPALQPFEIACSQASAS